MIAAALSARMRFACLLPILLLVCFCASNAASQSFVPEVLLTQEVVQRLKAQRHTDAKFDLKYKELIIKANAHLRSPTIVDILKKEQGEIHQAFAGFGERPVERLTTLAMAWRLTGDKRYAERTRMELLQLSNLDTWHPENFLGLSRVALAVSIAYSWINESLSPQDRQAIEMALIEKALKQADKIYDLDGSYFDHGWVVPQRWVDPTSIPEILPDGTGTADITWPVASFNWNIVCNAGMIVAALVVSEADPDLADRTIERAQSSIRNGVSVFAPDGAWSEGPMYGALATRDMAITIDALHSVLGHDFGLSNSVGLESFGEFIVHSTGPTGMLFNFGDSDTNTDLVALSWLASYFDRPGYDAPVLGTGPSSHPALELLWWKRPALKEKRVRQTAYWAGGLGIVTMRSAWDDPNATFVGLKAGPLRSHHNNLDAGTFVLEANGVRWAVDLGIGNYQLPGYFTDKRFDYYRTATIGQNTLTFGATNQVSTGRAQIKEFGQFPGFTFTIADLSDAYEYPKNTIMRGISLVDDTTVLVQDEFTRNMKGRVVWTMHTEADVSIDGSLATLRQNGQMMRVRLLSPNAAEFVLRSANPCETEYNLDCKDQNPNSGIKRLMVDVNPDDMTGTQTIAIAFESNEQSQDLTVLPLLEWSLAASLKQETQGQ